MSERVVYLVRHGESEANRLGIMQGWHDSDLSDNGRQQAQALHRWLGPYRVISSDLARAYKTARLLTEFPERVKTDRRLREIHVGQWQGMQKQQIVSSPRWQHYQNHPESFQFPQGETLGDVQTRMTAAFHDAVKDNDLPLVLVSHRVALRTLLVALAGKSLTEIHCYDLPNASVTRVHWTGSQAHILGVGELPE